MRSTFYCQEGSRQNRICRRLPMSLTWTLSSGAPTGRTCTLAYERDTQISSVRPDVVPTAAKEHASSAHADGASLVRPRRPASRLRLDAARRQDVREADNQRWIRHQATDRLDQRRSHMDRQDQVRRCPRRRLRVRPVLVHHVLCDAGKQVLLTGRMSRKYGAQTDAFEAESNSYLRPLMDPETGSIAGFNGKSSLLGDFEFDFTVKSKEGVDVSHLLFNDAPFTDVGHLKELVERSTVLVRDEDQLKLKLVGVHEDRPQDGEKPNLIAIQVNVPADTTIDIHFNVGKMRALRGKLFETELEQRSKRFGEKFEAAFGRMKDLPEFYQRMGEAALSNMLGSIGYFHGSNIVQSVHSEKLLKYGPHSLLSGVPSRPFFPRGFLWDEGFHNLLIRKFDQNLSFEIIASWLDTMNIDGWIPREMILGSEAELRVPAEFVVQRDSVANPPMFFYLMNNFLDDADFVKAHETSIKRLYPRLKVWYKWLRTTQSGSKPGAFRWRGRNATTELELNPKTLPSGLDDFPRASHPSDNERHLDLRCWMSFASKVLARLADLAEDWDYLPTIKTEAEALADLENLDKLHWSSAVNRYADFGNHSTKVKLEWRRVDSRNPERIEKRRKTVTPAVEQLVEDANGYLSLFPLMLQMLPADSPNLKLILEGLRDPKEMWSPHGLRSVAKSSPYYLADNTEHDRPYWRGAIWVNMNYMVLSALKQYGSETGPNQQMAHEIYAELRGNLVQNIARQFRKTGYLWEHYDDVDGHGKGSHPFTGWSALVLAIMAERYD
ncbi:hypothetical protein L596_017213 [Steinernema carpocapsae]|uniref:mannosyl-oligosaccharide glucosidase n=1 Tax=Steinernema carpocapsae TaxID=34508 RepID=A0A4U5N1R2_STECR|nr:hypothetical protein L596_017213 [Steinernema carpocapsae]